VATLSLSFHTAIKFEKRNWKRNGAGLLTFGGNLFCLFISEAGYFLLDFLNLSLPSSQVFLIIIMAFQNALIILHIRSLTPAINPTIATSN